MSRKALVALPYGVPCMPQCPPVSNTPESWLKLRCKSVVEAFQSNRAILAPLEEETKNKEGKRDGHANANAVGLLCFPLVRVY